MTTTWTRVTFGEVVTLAQGLCFNAKTNYLMAETGIPLLRIADLINNTQTKFVDAEKVPKKFVSGPQDIIYTRTGQVGLVFKGKVGVVHNNCFRVIPRDGVEADYVYWYLRQPSVIEKARSLAGGAAQPDLGHDAFKSILFTYPAPKVQRRIADILSAFDELIENSQRRIRILEAMARALYREWFVRKDVSTEKPSLDFQELTFGDLCELVKEPFSERLHSDRPLLDLSRMPQHSLAPADLGPANELATSRILFEPGDTLFGAIRCYLHKVVAVHYPGVTNTSVFVLRPTKEYFRSLVALIASDTETIRWADTHSAGTKMPVINWSVLRTMPAPVPSDSTASRFESIAGSMMDQIGVLATQIQNLRRTCDLLLPRLLSGQMAINSKEL